MLSTAGIHDIIRDSYTENVCMALLSSERTIAHVCLSFLIQTTIHSDGLHVHQSLKQTTKRKLILTTSGISNSPLYTPFLSSLAAPDHFPLESILSTPSALAHFLLVLFFLEYQK